MHTPTAGLTLMAVLTIARLPGHVGALHVGLLVALSVLVAFFMHVALHMTLHVAAVLAPAHAAFTALSLARLTMTVTAPTAFVITALGHTVQTFTHAGNLILVSGHRCDDLSDQILLLSGQVQTFG
jgi:hypothetical protein